MQPRSSIFIFGQQASSSGGVGPLLLWTGVLIVVVVISAVVLAWIRRQLVNGGVDGSGEGWSLHSLRELHKRGELSGEEFERAKAVLLGSMKKDPAEALDRGAAVDLTGDPLPRRSDDESGASTPIDDPQVP